MSIQVNIAEAKAKLSELVSRAEAGEQVIIARHGKGAVRLSPVRRERAGSRRIGIWDDLNLDLSEDLFIGPDADTAIAVDGPVFPPE
jgi:prevent-host-death family protein